MYETTRCLREWMTVSFLCFFFLSLLFCVPVRFFLGLGFGGAWEGYVLGLEVMVTTARPAR